MPVAFLELPSGLGMDTKKKLVKDVADAIHDAYQIPDTRVFLREWPTDQTSIDGQLGRPLGPSATSSFRPGFPSTRNESWSSG